MKLTLITNLILLVLSFAHVTAAEAVAEFDGKSISLTKKCSVSKYPDSVYVMIGIKKFKVELPKPFQFRFDAGEKAWIGLNGTLRIKKIGDPGLTAEYADGFIEVKELLFYDQKDTHKQSIKILKKDKPSSK